MKSKQLFTKMLLVALCLIGGSGFAWAGQAGVVTTNAKVLFNGSITVANPCTYTKGADEICGTTQGWFWKASGSDVSTGGGIDSDGHMTFNNGNMTIAMTNGSVGAKDIVNVSFWIAFGGHTSENANQTIQLLTSGGDNIATEQYNNTEVVSSTMGLSATDLEAIGFGGSWRNTSWSERVKFNFTLNYATRKISLVIINASNVEKVNKEIDMPEGAGYITGINIGSSNQKTTGRGILLDNVYITTTEGDYGDIVSPTNSYTVNTTDVYQLFTEIQCPDITLELWGNASRSTTDYYFKYTDGEGWASYEMQGGDTETYSCSITKYNTNAPTIEDISGADSPSDGEIAKVTVTVSDSWNTLTQSSTLCLQGYFATAKNGYKPTGGSVFKFTPTKDGYLNIYYYKYHRIQYRVWISGNSYYTNFKSDNNEFKTQSIWLTKDRSYYIFSDNTEAYQLKINSFEFVPEVSKNITSAGWATYCSPYALDFSEVEGLTAYIVTGGADGKLTTTEVTSVPAGTGVLLKGAAGDYTIPVATSSATDVTDNKLTGVTTQTQIDANAGYVLMNGSEGVAFYKNAKAFTVGANTAYLPANFDANAARAFFSFGDDATDIRLIENGKIENSVYDLQGRRIDGSRMNSGIYIHNGRKVFVK